ncbi:MAG TPA: hypothetical protein VF457_06110 [Burkholderiaceae bacterium]
MTAAQEKAPAVGTTRGELTRSLESAQSPCVGLSAVAAPAWKRSATLVARAALAGAVLVEATDDAGRPGWILTADASTRRLADLAEVERAVDLLESRA